MATTKDKLKASAQRFDEKGQYDKALKEYLRVVAEDDADVRSWLKIGDLNIKLRRVEDAIAAYQRAAQLYGDQGFARKAVAVYKQIVKINPKLIAVHLRLADLCQELGLVADALAHYEQVAAFYVREGKTEEALRVMLRMVGLDPNNASSRVKLAELYLKAQKTREATEQFQQAITSLRGQDRTDDFFMKVAERLLFLSPDNHALARELAARYLEKSDPRRALPKLRQAYKANPRDPETLQLLAQAFVGLGQTAKAVSVLQEMARIYTENKDAARRDDTYRRILQLSPGDAEALSALRTSTSTSPSPSRMPPPPPPGAAAGTAAAGPRSGDESITGQRRAAPPPPGPNVGLGPPRRTPTPPPFSVQRGGGTPSLVPATPAISLGDWTALGPADRDKEIARILEETDAYRKFGLHDMAVAHVKQVFEISPDHLGARERLVGLYSHLGRADDAVAELWALHQQSAGTPRGENYLREIVKLRPSDERAKRLLAELPPHALPPPPPATSRAAAPPPKPPAPVEPLDALEVVELGEDLVVEESSQASASIDIPIDEDIGLDTPGGGDVHRPMSTQPSWPSLSDRIVTESTSQDEAGEPLLIDDDDLDSLQFGPGDPQEHSFVGEPTASGWKAPIALEAGAAAGQGGQRARAPASVLEDELERSDYYLQQGFVGEARGILTALLERFPAHPLVTAKLRDLEQGEGDLGSGAATHLPEGVPEDFGPLPQGIEPSVRVRIEGSTMFEQSSSEDTAVAPEDFDTHYDLGIAYKEMGLLDEAVNEFRIVMQDPNREVQCHMMLGLIFLEQGRVTEAISQFKQGLYAERIQEREQLALYYELGNAYEKVSDTREALYYLEKVMKRDAQFRDVEQRVARLRGGGRRGGENLLVSVKDDIDQAFEGLVNDVMRGK
ncbi:MAG TPA: tetratricopeptide repeat protein [Polyangia bacterium]|nr:tetratricopeptide repeat protein [Polyangia bacterium]